MANVHPKALSRRTLIAWTSALLVSSRLRASPATKLDSPIRAVRVRAPTRIPGNFGDSWALAWADDGNLYSAVDDGTGFNDFSDLFSVFNAGQQRRMENDPDASKKINAEDNSKALEEFSITPQQLEELGRLHTRSSQWRAHNQGGFSLCFTRITGDRPLKLAGATVNGLREFNELDHGKEVHLAPGFEVGGDGRTWKSGGCSFIDGTLYLSISRHDYGDPFGKRLRQDALNASFIKSIDYGKTWTPSPRKNFESPMFPGAHFATPYFIDYGRARPAVDGADSYVYAVSNNGFWDNGDTLILGRAPRAKLGELNGRDWEFFTGGEGMNAANWTRAAADAQPLLEDRLKVGETGAVYLPARRRYMMITWYYPDGTGHSVGASHRTVWNFHEAPHPWGPWTQIGSHTWYPQGYYCPGICPKFQSENRVYVMTAGDFSNAYPYYHLTVVPVDLN